MRVPEVGSIPHDSALDPLAELILSIQNEAHGNRVYMLMKRGFDVVAAFTLMVICLPLLLIIAAAIKMTSRGPVLFTQERVGLGGKPFKFYKFRSMKHGNDNSIHRDFMRKLIRGEFPAGEAGVAPHFKMKHDPRITQFGRFLRKTSLDELPQLFNVLNGTMSLVGPRPPIPYEVRVYKSWHMQRLNAKPGLTGLWQVNGRSSVSFDDMVRLDITYIENRSFLLDIGILIKTIPAIINTSTAA